MIPAAFHVAILRSAAVLVPEAQRTDWLAEWRSELWHVRRDPHGPDVTAFCIGAFRDAFWLRHNEPIQRFPGVLRLNVPATPAGIETFPDEGVSALSSPVQCLSLLAALVALCFVAALLLPAARMVLRCALYPADLVMLSPVEAGDPSVQNGFFDPYPSVSRKQFASLKAHSAGQFTGLAFYVPARLPVETPSGKRTLTVARTTADLLRLLNIPVERGNSGGPVLVPGYHGPAEALMIRARFLISGWGLFVLTAALLLAQRGGGRDGSIGVPTPTTADLTVHGSVTLPDSVIPERLVLIEKMCGGRIETTTYADSKGRFAFDLGMIDRGTAGGAATTSVSAAAMASGVPTGKVITASEMKDCSEEKTALGELKFQPLGKLETGLLSATDGTQSPPGLSEWDPADSSFWLNTLPPQGTRQLLTGIASGVGDCERFPWNRPRRSRV